MGAILVLLILAVLITAVSVYYAFPQRVEVEVPIDLPACPGGEPRDANYNCPPPPPPTPLKVIGPWAAAEEAAFLPALDLFSRKTGIEYEYTTVRQEDLQTSLPLDFAAQQAPADLIFMPSSFVRQYGIDGHAMDLTGTVGDAGYPTGQLDPVKDGTAIYGGAYTGKIKPGFWYRKSFFTANGLSEPTTWAEFTTLLADIEPLVTNEAIISGDTVGWPLSDVVEYFIATYGGPQMHRDLMAGTLSWEDATVKSVFNTYLVPTLTPGTVCVASCWSAPRAWDTGVDEWWAGDYGLYFMGSWITGMVPDPGDLGVVTLPEAPGAEGFVFAADWFFVPTYTGMSTEALQLAAFLAGPEAQESQVRQGGHVATALGVPRTAYPVVDAVVKDLLEAALAGGKEVLADLDDTIGGTFQPAFWNELKGLWADPTTVDTVLANIEAAAP